MGQAESNESAAVKRQAEGGAIPMYELLDLGGMRFLFWLTVFVFKVHVFWEGLKILRNLQLKRVSRKKVDWQIAVLQPFKAKFPPST